ncbi:MAG: 2-phosphosulfolactate phosphatase [Actinomycetota bacterium]
MIDAFRASTSICVLVSRGVRVVPVASLERAARAEADYRIGERGSAKVAGFDFGNSPTELAAADLRPGSTAALSTTNGTRVLEAAEGAPVLLTGAFVNATALAIALHLTGLEIVVVGCGWEGRRALEDEMAAGAILHRLAKDGISLDRRAEAVAKMYRTRPKSDVLRSSAARRLERLGYTSDLTFCIEEDTVPVVPQLKDGVFDQAVSGLWAAKDSRVEAAAYSRAGRSGMSGRQPEVASRDGGV